MFMRHGKSEHLGLWKLSSLMESNANLVEFSPQRCDNEHVLPDEGLLGGLASKVVILSSSAIK